MENLPSTENSRKKFRLITKLINLVVLVSGASGYLAIHCVQQLLNLGYYVRGTVRSLNNEAKCTPLKDLPNSNKLELIEADLEKPDSWTR